MKSSTVNVAGTSIHTIVLARGLTLMIYLVISVMLHFWLSSLSYVKLGSIAQGPLKDKATPLFKDEAPTLCLSPGELPGYTGWPRPENTLAGYFRIASYSPDGEVGTEWSISVTCDHPECINGGSHFFVRAYGPAVIVGTVQDFRNGSYRIGLVPLDPGHYTVEVVIVASNPLEWGSFPLSLGCNEPYYEGFTLPGFPIQMAVKASPITNRKGSEFCSFNQLIESDCIGTERKGRWVVTDKVADRNHRERNHPDKISLKGYQGSQNSLGIMMEYAPTNCSLLSSQQSNSESQWDAINKCFSHSSTIVSESNMHVIFIGDSVTNMQKELFDTFVVGTQIRTTLISTKGGIVRRFQEVIEKLDAILEASQPDEHRFLLFNTGLHDIAQLCSQKWSTERRKYMKYDDSEFSCQSVFRTTFQMLVNFIEQYPADLRVFQSTTAGWPRYGNYGFDWKPTVPQPFTLSSNFVARFNEIACSIVRPHSNIHTMDGYWITLARPDNREVDSENSIGKHLVHPGLEVLGAMGRIWLMIIMRTVCSSALDND